MPLDPAVRDSILHDVSVLRDSFASDLPRPLEARLDMLDRLRRAIVQETPRLRQALARDLGKSRAEAGITEIGFLLTDIDHIRKHLRSWLRPQKAAVGTLLAPASVRLHREPLGTVLIIAPWNYPLQLMLSPLIGAIAGGNTVLLKPSEVSSATSAAIAALVREHLDPAWVRVVEGAVEETTLLLEQPWDLIFYTGNSTVGRIVARAAAEHLTPTILELGGKSPVYIDDTVDLAAAARRIIWGKTVNAGQTCVAPDYLMATRPVLDALIPHLRTALREMHGKNPMRSGEYGRIINHNHLERLLGLIDQDKVVIGGQSDRRQRYIAPTVMDGVEETDAVMGEEIFGPILPLVEVTGAMDAAERIRAGDKPLAAYLFSEDEDVRRLFTGRTSSGSLAVGLTVAHLSAAEMPFGGVGESGMGAYHGKASLEAFTHIKPVVIKPLRPDTLRLVYPPFRGLKKVLIRALMRG